MIASTPSEFTGQEEGQEIFMIQLKFKSKTNHNPRAFLGCMQLIPVKSCADLL